MNKKAKRFARMAANPNADWTIQDVQAICEEYGLTVRQAGGSHCTVSHPSQSEILTIPVRRPIKPVYIKSFVAFVGNVEKGLGR